MDIGTISLVLMLGLILLLAIGMPLGFASAILAVLVLVMKFEPTLLWAPWTFGDGILTGINWDSTLALAGAVSIPVIASGGLASLDDVRRMLQPDARKLEGAISGRALYDGRIDPAEALALIRSARNG